MGRGKGHCRETSSHSWGLEFGGPHQVIASIPHLCQAYPLAHHVLTQMGCSAQRENGGTAPTALAPDLRILSLSLHPSRLQDGNIRGISKQPPRVTALF